MALLKDTRWNEMFNVYVEYIDRYTEFPSIGMYYKDEPIGQWFRNQITAYNAGIMPKPRIEMMDSIIPEWKEPFEIKDAVMKNLKREKKLRFAENIQAPDGDVSIAKVFADEDVLILLDKKIFTCIDYLRYYEKEHTTDWQAFVKNRQSTNPQERVFSLENRKKVFTAVFPNISFGTFNLIRAVTYGIYQEEDDIYKLSYVDDAIRHNMVRSSYNETEEEIETLFRSMQIKDRAKEIINFRFYEGMSQDEIAEIYGVTRERIRQLEKKILEKFRQKTVINRLRCVGINGVFPENEEIRAPHVGIEILGLSPRAYNALKRAHIDYVDELTDLSVRDLQTIKNIGGISINEILEKLEDSNLSLRERLI